MIALILLAVALASDAFAVAMARGACDGHGWRKALTVAGVFAACQAIAAFLGWLLGTLLGDAFKTAEAYISCAALCLLGALMIKAAIEHKDEAEVCQVPESPVLALLGLLGVGIAVSLDAMGAGVALPLLGFPIYLCALTIFIVCFIMSLTGYKLGAHAGKHLGTYAEMAGGFVLIGLGLHLLK